jgi:hypothetical protein
MNQIQKLQERLKLYLECEAWFLMVKDKLETEHKVFICDGGVDNRTVFCKYAITLILKEKVVSNLFIQDLFGYSVPSTVSIGYKQAVYLHKSRYPEFMFWHGIVDKYSKD